MSTTTTNVHVAARDLKVGDVIGLTADAVNPRGWYTYGKVTDIMPRVGAVFVWLVEPRTPGGSADAPGNRPADLILNHSDPVRLINEEA